MTIATDFTIDYTNKLFYHTSGTEVFDANAIYSYLQDTFDEIGQMDDDVPMSAQTPTEYTLINGWFMGDLDMEYINGGAFQTSGWAGDVIIKADYTVSTTEFVDSDRGLPITSTTYDGVLMDFNAATGEFWVRPDSGGGDFSTSEVLTVTGGSGDVTITTTTNVSGENLWANPFTLGTIQPDTQLYIVQNSAPVISAALSATTPWWTSGQIDICLKVKDMGVEIDNGVIEVFAHKPGTLMDVFQIDLTSGGRQPVPLATSSDLNDQNGHRSISIDGTGAFNLIVGEIATGVTSTATGLITAVTGTPATNIEYFLIGDLTQDFNAAEQIDGSISGVNGGDSNGAAADANIATNDWNVFPAFVYSSAIDIGDGAGNYAITVDCSGYTTLKEVYERFKHDTKRGDTDTTTFNGIQGEEYVGLTVAIAYTPGTDPTTIGQVMTGGTSNATGILAAVDSAGDNIYLHNVKGSFTDTETVTGASDGSCTNITATSIAINKQGSLASFAGGTMFGAQGVRFTNVPGVDVNSYFQTDLAGTAHAEPVQRTLTLGKMSQGDSYIMTDRTASVVDKAQTTVSSTPALGATSITLTGDISTGRPATNGVLVIDQGDGTEHHYRYASMAAAVVTLDDISATATAGGSTTLLSDTGTALISLQPGDRGRNTTDGENFTVVSVTDTDNVVVEAVGGGALSNTLASKAYTINAVNVAGYNGNNVFIPYLYGRLAPDAGTDVSVATTIIFNAAEDIRIAVRQKGILPFTIDTALSDANFNQDAIRTTDSIVTP